MKSREFMDKSVEAALGGLGKSGTLTPVDPGQYRTIVINPLMKFHVEQYALEGVGNVSVMRMKTGPMAMVTVVASPYKKNAPLMSVDLIGMMSNRKVYIEFYDLVAEKDEAYMGHIGRLAGIGKKYNTLAPLTPTPAWYDHLLTATAYKSGKASDDETIVALLRECAESWAGICAELPDLDEYHEAEKRGLTREYSNGLVEKGGVSTNVFKKSLGEETTLDFFGRVFFGTI